MALAWLTMGCQPDIGDACELPSDCSASGDRICDTTFKGGYCTQFNCEPGDCPEEAVCVAFLGAPSSAQECKDLQETPRFERTFCMKSCEDNSDCREEEGYRCLDAEAVKAWSATVVERSGGNKKVCMTPYDGASTAPGETEVCSPPADASFPPPLQSVPGDGGVEASIPDATVPDGAVPPEASTPIDGATAPDSGPDGAVGPPPPDAAPTDAAPVDAAPADAPVGG